MGVSERQDQRAVARCNTDSTRSVTADPGDQSGRRPSIPDRWRYKDHFDHSRRSKILPGQGSPGLYKSTQSEGSVSRVSPEHSGHSRVTARHTSGLDGDRDINREAIPVITEQSAGKGRRFSPKPSPSNSPTSRRRAEVKRGLRLSPQPQLEASLLPRERCRPPVHSASTPALPVMEDDDGHQLTESPTKDFKLVSGEAHEENSFSSPLSTGEREKERKA